MTINLTALAAGAAALLGLLAFVKTVVSPIRTILGKVKANDTATVAILRHTILRSCEDAELAGRMSAHMLEALEALHTPYKALGGNGFIAGRMEKARELERKEGS